MIILWRSGGAARVSQKEPGAARRSQEEPKGQVEPNTFRCQFLITKMQDLQREFEGDHFMESGQPGAARRSKGHPERSQEEPRAARGSQKELGAARRS